MNSKEVGKIILITGDKGFIGSCLSKNLEYIGIDLKDGKNILDCELPDADVIIHLAAQKYVIDSIKDPETTAINNIIGTIRLANRYKDSKFIFISSGGTIKETIESPYGLSKYCGEEFVKLLCKNYVILRLPNIYGPGSSSVVEKFINGEINIFGDGTAIRNYVHVDDISDAIIQSINFDTGTYFLGYKRPHAVIELAEATGKKINFKDAIVGELKNGDVGNNTSWVPKIDVIEYIKEWT